MKTLYVVDHFVPFPQSEYGGIWNVVAENDEELKIVSPVKNNKQILENEKNLKDFAGQ